MKYLYLGLASVAAVFAYLAFTVAQLPGSDGLPNGPGYISDEVWYVTSARNILHDVFKTPAASPYFTVGERCLTRG
ncbi:MAG: glycosyltransferase, partial [Pyrobaculum sp.]